LYGSDSRTVEAKGGHSRVPKAALNQTVLRNTASTGKIDGCKKRNKTGMWNITFTVCSNIILPCTHRYPVWHFPPDGPRKKCYVLRNIKISSRFSWLKIGSLELPF
jgi:hypothetical protein